MPRVPKWLGDTMEAVFSSQIRPVTVTHILELDRGLRKIRFEGDLAAQAFVPGQVIEFRVSPNDFRHYTPSVYDAKQGICDVLFYTHGKGPGSHWVNALRTGDQAQLIGPGGRLAYRPACKYHFFFGDETSLGLFHCLKEQVNQADQDYLCLLELEPGHARWADLAGISADVVCPTPFDPAREAIAQLNELPQPCWEAAAFYLTGNARSVHQFRKALLRKGIKYRQIFTEPYWAEGKAGM